jgi:hypothetical protein
MATDLTDYAAEQIERGAYLIPGHMLGGIKRYILNGIPPGGFLSALLSNDFMGAIGKADEDNSNALKGWAQFLYNYGPNGCFGSPGAFSKWIERGGMAGGEAEETRTAPLAGINDRTFA